MSEEIKTEGDESSAPKTEKNPHLEQAIKDRNVLKARVRELEAAASQRDSESAAAKDAAAQEEERKRSDWTALESRYKSQLAERDQKLADAMRLIEGRTRQDRESLLVDAVAGKLGATNRTLIKGLLKVAAESGFDAAPESLNDQIVADAMTKVRELSPELFKARSNGSPGSPGLNDTNRPDTGDDPKERVRALARSLSTARRPAPKE